MIDRREAINKIRSTEGLTISSTVAAYAMGIDPVGLRLVARANPEELPFPVIMAGRNVRVMRVPFMKFCGIYEEGVKNDF